MDLFAYMDPQGLDKLSPTLGSGTIRRPTLCDAFSIHPALQGRLQFRPGRFKKKMIQEWDVNLSIETNDFTMFDCLIMFDTL